MTRVRVTDPVCLSETGSTRATAYTLANRAVRVGERSHAVWLDGVADVTAATFDHGNGRWSSPVRVDSGRDNHACPSLTAAPDGRLRVAYGPRSCADPFSDRPMDCWAMGKFRILQSTRPGDAAAWERLSHAGYAATYGCLVTDRRGRDHLVYNGGAAPPAARYERRQPDDAWDRDVKLMHQDVGHNYTFTGANLVCAPGGTLYCGFHYYALPRDASLGVCALASPDGGETWAGVDSRPARLPLLYSPEFAVPHAGRCPYLGSLAVDPEGNPVAVTNDWGDTAAGCFVSVFRGGAWQATRVDGLLPGRQVQNCSVTVDAGGRILVALDAVDAGLPTVAQRWNHPSSEVFLLASGDGGRTFEAVQVSPASAEVANWLPTISRVGPNHDMRSPLILYTQGVAGTGKDCIDPERTRVFAAWVE